MEYQNQFIETYKGVRCYFHHEDGFWGQRSASEQYGYADTIGELREEIDFDDDSESDIWHDDTPSLDDSFHRHEMDV